ncbi:hypothetical protein [Pseudomonas sp. TUM22785]|nr:hypothetical protein [Pseudomonas sp. TUM22785]WCD78869.1 hypothetical protein PI990_23130 [Pseudomonas sp. TUM22785]
MTLFSSTSSSTRDRMRDDLDYLQHFDYIHINPVKHGHARRGE